MTENPFHNTYDEARRADSYADLGFQGTYYLAVRDLPRLLQAHVTGRRALDFGCGAGRSTRFLAKLGYEVTGVDISRAMLDRALHRDPTGDYRLIPPGDLSGLGTGAFDLILAMYPFDNIPTAEEKVHNLAGLAALLAPAGCVVNVVSSPDIYTHEWLSFSSRDFPDNRCAASGDRVRVVMLDVEDSRPVEDILWDHESWLDVYRSAGLRLLATHRPLGRIDDGYRWETERRVAPWVIYVLSRPDAAMAA